MVQSEEDNLGLNSRALKDYKRGTGKGDASQCGINIRISRQRKEKKLGKARVQCGTRRGEAPGMKTR